MELGKVNRILKIYDKLINGESINKKELANEFDVNIRTIQRDIAVSYTHLTLPTILRV